LNTSSAGKAGEDAAANYLSSNGMLIIARNYRSPYGEVDIVALDHGALVFIEVKSWSKFPIESLEFSINEKKQKKIIETAKYFIANNRKYSNTAVRFDVVFVGLDSIKHLSQAFMENI
jgi:putative endonuclease